MRKNIYTNEDREDLLRFHTHSHKTLEESKTFFETQILLIFLDFLQGEKTNIPLLGELSIKHVKDVLKKQGKEAVLQITIEPSEFLKRVIGQSADDQITEIHKIYVKNVISTFKQLGEDK